ncbi:MAG: hypothetical protein KIH67_003965 [Candidatus Moranbacteria bacterium]|nr:hypothetical protein [Candidatus Moranbacteria bacterium]
MNFSKLFGGEHPPTKKPEEKPETVPHPSDERITFFESTQARVAGEGGLALKDSKPQIASVKVEFSGIETGVPLQDKNSIQSEVLHSNAYHIKPAMPDSSVKATSQPIAKPTSMKVKIGEGAPVKVDLDKPINLALSHEDLSSLISRAEDPNTPSHVRAILHSNIIERQSGKGPKKEFIPPKASDIPEPEASTIEGSDIKAQEKVENPFEEEKESSEVGDQASELLTDEQKLLVLLENIKTAPVKERPAMLREIARLKRTEKEKEERREAVGNKIIRSSSDAARARAQKETLEARIEAEKQKRKEAGQPETGAFLTKLEKRLKEAVGNLTRAEQSYKDLTAEFLALGGTQDQIEALIASNTEEEKVEKPLVGEDAARKEEIDVIAEEVADPILGAMAAGLAVENFGENEEVVPASLPAEIPQFEQGENLEQALDAARRAYVEADVVNRDKRKRLALHFPWLEDEKNLQENPDLVQLREKYRAIQKQIQEQSFAKIASVQSGPERDAEFKKFLFENSFGEALSLDNEYQAVLKEKRGLGGKILSAYEGMGNWYNGLSLKKKAIIGATLFSGSLALGATGMGIGIPAVVWLRRFMAGSGSAIKLDAIAERWQEGANAKKIEEHLERAVDNSRELTSEELLAKMQAYLQVSEKAIDQELIKRRKSRAKRKWGSRLAGAFGGVAISELVAYGFAPDTVEAAGSAGSAAGAVGMEQEVGGEIPSSPQGGVSPESTPLSGDAGAGAGTEVEGVAEAGAPGITGIPHDYQVTTDDGRRGLWGILEKSLPADMSEADRVERIGALEKIIALKVANLSPELQAEYGFQGGNINIIQPGSTIQFDKLLTPEEWQNPGSVNVEALASSASVEGVATAEPSVLGQETPSRIDEHFLDGLALEEQAAAEAATESVTAETGAPENLLEGVEIGGSNLVVEDMPADPTRAVLESGVDPNTFRESLQNFRIGVLTTPETANWLKYNPVGHAFEMKSVPMGDIIAAHESIVLNGTYDTALPFHESQIERLHEMTTEAVKTYGESARPGRLETFETYTRRLIALGFQNTAKN